MKTEDKVREVIVSLIYHGRYFSKKRDATVIKKALKRMEDIYLENMRGKDD